VRLVGAVKISRAGMWLRVYQSVYVPVSLD